MQLTGYALDISESMRAAANEAIRASAEWAAIEQVKGALIATYAFDATIAFEVIRRYSMTANVRAAALCARAVERLGDPKDQVHRQEGDLPLLRLLDEVGHELQP